MRRSSWPCVVAVLAACSSSPSSSGVTPTKRLNALSASERDESVNDRPGATSGRHFRQGRKCCASACAALGKKRQFSRRGVRTRHTGRQ